MKLYTVIACLAVLVPLASSAGSLGKVTCLQLERERKELAKEHRKLYLQATSIYDNQKLEAILAQMTNLTEQMTNIVNEELARCGGRYFPGER